MTITWSDATTSYSTLSPTFGGTSVRTLLTISFAPPSGFTPIVNSVPEYVATDSTMNNVYVTQVPTLQAVTYYTLPSAQCLLTFPGTNLQPILLNATVINSHQVQCTTPACPQFNDTNLQQTYCIGNGLFSLLINDQSVTRSENLFWIDPPQVIKIQPSVVTMNDVSSITV